MTDLMRLDVLDALPYRVGRPLAQRAAALLSGEVLDTLIPLVGGDWGEVRSRIEDVARATRAGQVRVGMTDAEVAELIAGLPDVTGATGRIVRDLAGLAASDGLWSLCEDVIVAGAREPVDLDAVTDPWQVLRVGLLLMAIYRLFPLPAGWGAGPAGTTEASPAPA
jgi:hypothetical protein